MPTTKFASTRAGTTSARAKIRLTSRTTIQVTPRLKLNLGLRWQFTPYPSDKYNIFSSFDPKNMAIVMGQNFDTLYKVGATSPALVATP